MLTTLRNINCEKTKKNKLGLNNKTPNVSNKKSHFDITQKLKM